jgi:beta-1,4-mannosyltransferase
MANRSDPQPIRVLLATSVPKSEAHYISLLVRGVPPEIRFTYFSWKTAFFTKYDVLHLHWPERLLNDNSALKRLVKALLLLMLLKRLQVGGVAVVRTVHNLTTHSANSHKIAGRMARIDAATTAFIHLNRSVPFKGRGPGTVIPHGHYGALGTPTPTRRAKLPQLLFIGRIEPYKGVEKLLEVFGQLAVNSSTLRIVGNPGKSLRAIVDAAQSANHNISASLSYATDSALIDELDAATLVVLPYKYMHNSGVAILALSFHRPILVPNTAATAELAAEVGESWVIRYDGELTAEALRRAMSAANDMRSHRMPPRLIGRDWQTIGEKHRETYLEAISIARKRKARQT